ncbi:MAG: MopE-related protein [Myxococcota bacterium]
MQSQQLSSGSLEPFQPSVFARPPRGWLRPSLMSPSSVLLSSVLLSAVLWSLGAALSGCSGSSEDTSPTPLPGDYDGDGYTVETGDCNEADTSINPGGTESCNGLDDDCNGSIDPGCDEDGDGFLASSAGGEDCDDTAPEVYPGAAELCDTVDNNCDTQVDNIPDRDGDGFTICESDSASNDCNDANPAVYPGAPELFDGLSNDCQLTTSPEQLELSAVRATLIGEYAGDAAGFALSSGGDLNGDGYGDLLVGAPRADGGKTYVLLGGPSGLLKEANAGRQSTLDLSYADSTLRGESLGDGAGAVVQGVGDLNDDGLDDLWIGAPQANAGGGVGYLVPGRTTWGPLYSLAVEGRAFEGGTDASFGSAAAGDFNGDEVPDLLMGAPGEQTDLGAVYLLYGASTLFAQPDEGEPAGLEGLIHIEGIEPDGQLGFALAAGCDLQGDGRSELVLAAPGADQVYIFFGRSSSWRPDLNEADITLRGEPGSLTGQALSCRSDLNHDGYADLVVGAPGASLGAGQLYVVFGKPSGLAQQLDLGLADVVLEGDAGAALGASLSTGGDINQDGIDDLVVGAPGVGASWLILGRTPTQSWSSGPVELAAAAELLAPSEALTGAAVAIVSDLNADGAAEWALGAPAESTGGENAGAIYLLYGY